MEVVTIQTLLLTSTLAKPYKLTGPLSLTRTLEARTSLLAMRLKPSGGSGYAVTSWKNLYKCHIPITGSVTTYRVYFWHVNDYSSGSTQFAIRLSVPGGATVTNYKRKSFVGTYNDIVSKGMCIAERHLFNLLTEVAGTWSIPTSGEFELWNVTATNKVADRYSLVVAVHEFDLSDFGQSGEYLNLRSIVSRNGQWGNAGDYDGSGDDDVAADATTHPRGWWPYSKVRLKHTDVFNCAQGGTHPMTWQRGICESNGGEYEAEAFKLQAGQNPDNTQIDRHGRTNAGCYGADLRYRLLAFSDGDRGRLHVGLRSRNVQEKNAGAGRVVAPTPLAQSCIPKFPCDYGSLVDHWNFLNLLEFKSPDRYYALSTNDSIVVDVDIAIAGGAAMPMNLLLTRESVVPAPNEGPD